VRVRSPQTIAFRSCPVLVRVAGVLGFLWSCMGSATAQEGLRAPPFPIRPTIAATRIEPGEAPSIDGDLSEPVWAKAKFLDKFWQAMPNPGDAATERTVVRVLYDENNLYFGIYAYDSRPDQISVRAMARDGQIGSGDTVRLVLDPGMSKRNGYTFQLGPSGGRIDALLQNNTDNLQQWDAIWSSRARVVSDGWIVEVAIPFRSLSYERGRTDWGFEVTRQIRHKNETVRWSNYNPAVNFTDLTGAGTLTGITGIREGLGLDLQLYGVARAKRDWHIPGEDTGLSFTAGGNAFYKLTPSLTGTLTFNPDFSDAPLDARQINTTRFSLFTPETRDFFLQDAAAFEFGGRNFIDANNGRPFFSRNIGLARGVPISLVGGGKLSGEYGGFDIGGLSVVTDRPPGEDRQVLSVARVTHPVLAESKLGFIVTNGDPTGATENSVAGVDFQFRDSDFAGKILQSDLYYERSFSSRFGDDDSFGAGLNFPNEPWGGQFVVKRVGTNFRPALGFVNRSGIWSYVASGDYTRRFRNAPLREASLQTDNTFITGLNGHLESRENDFNLHGQTPRNEQFDLGLKSFFESVPAPFALPGNVIVPAGDYSWNNAHARFVSSQMYALQVEVEASCCSFYNGRGVELQAELNYRPNQYFELQPSYEGTFIDLPTGSVNIHLLAADVILNFTPDMQVALQTQYDNISESFGLLARYRWEFRPGSELFVAFGQAAVIPGTTFKPQRSQLQIRLGHTFRF
jgi:hypothetical protein